MVKPGKGMGVACLRPRHLVLFARHRL